MRFYESQGALYAEENGEREVLVTGRFMLSENQTKVSDYLRLVAEKLNTMEPFSDEMSDYLEQVEGKVRSASTAEKFLEDVNF